MLVYVKIRLNIEKQQVVCYNKSKTDIEMMIYGEDHKMTRKIISLFVAVTMV